MKYFCLIVTLSMLLSTVGCNSAARKVKYLELGMTPSEVRDKIGDPYTIRAAKVYEDGHSTQIWEYTPAFALNPQTYHVYFENNKVVQWGQPGDFGGKAGANVPVIEYKAFKDK